MAAGGPGQGPALPMSSCRFRVEAVMDYVVPGFFSKNECSKQKRQKNSPEIQLNFLSFTLHKSN